MRYDVERQILGMFQTLLGGSVVMWQTNELTIERRVQLRKIGLEYILQELRTCFDSDMGMATCRFNDNIVTLKDIVKDNIALSQYIQKMLYYTYSVGLLNNNNSNWYGPMITIQSNMDIKIRQYLRPPDLDDGQLLANYIRQVEKVYAILLAAIYNIYLQYIKKKVGKSSSSKPDEPVRELSFSYKKDRSSYKEYCEYRECYYEEDYRRGSYYQWRDRSQIYREERSSDYKKRDEDRNRYNRDRRNMRYCNDKRDYKDRKYCEQDRIYFVEGSSSSNIDELESISSYSTSSLQSSSNSGSKEVAYIVINTNLIYYKCYRTFIARRDQKHYVKVYKGSRLLKYKCYAIYNALNPSRCIYSFCSSLFPTCSQLFQHLKTYKDVKNSTLRQPTDLASLLAEAKQQTIQQQTAFVQQQTTFA